ncbi:hypothetical protein BDR22DRAFT_960313 [Usnea florida]
MPGSRIYPLSFLCKFVGTISLGLLTGVSYTTITTTLPPIQSLPSSQPASSTFQHVRTLVHRHQLLLSTISSSSLLLAYAISPPRRRHPYLLWATFAIGLGYTKEIYAGVVGKAKTKGEESGIRSRTPDSSDEEWEVEGGSAGGMNGEAVREGMEKWRGKMLGRTWVWGVGWLVTVVGLWGDGV